MGMRKGLVCLAVLGSVLAVSAESKFPLRIKADVSTKRENVEVASGIDGNARMENVQVNVELWKSGGQPYEGQLTAELYVIGSQVHTKKYGIIDVIKKDFTFNKENNNSFSFSSKSYALGKTSGNINVGGKYETYLLVIVDADGKIVETRSGRSIKPKGIDFIRELGPMTLFDKEGNVLGKVENPGEAFKKAVPVAADPGNDD